MNRTLGYAKSRAFSLVLFAMLGIGSVSADDPYSTISAAAREYVIDNQPGDLAPDNIEEWQQVSGAIGEPGVLTEADAAVVAASGATVTTLKIAETTHLLITPRSNGGTKTDRIIIYVHGGAYTLARPEIVVGPFTKIATLTGAPVIGLRYPMAWQAARPAQSDRVLDVYREILKTHSPRHIVMVGDSAGGGLIMTSVLRLRDEGLPMPAALGLISPWADLSKTGTSLYTLADGGDPIIDWDKSLAPSAKLYAGDAALTDPAVSPLYGDFNKGFPPSYISTGTRDLFLSHCARLQRVLTDAGVANELFVYEGMWHVFQQDFSLPETEAAWQDLVAFLEQYWAR